MHTGADIIKAGIDRLLHQGVHIHALDWSVELQTLQLPTSWSRTSTST